MSGLDLERIRDWAIAKLSREKELKRTVHEYLNLRETAESILAAMDVAKSETALLETPKSGEGDSASARLVQDEGKPNSVTT